MQVTDASTTNAAKLQTQAKRAQANADGVREPCQNRHLLVCKLLQQRPASFSDMASARRRTLLGLPVELDIRIPPGLVHQLERVYAGAVHVAVVLRDADVVQQECELQREPSRAQIPVSDLL